MAPVRLLEKDMMLQLPFIAEANRTLEFYVHLKDQHESKSAKVTVIYYDDFERLPFKGVNTSSV